MGRIGERVYKHRTAEEMRKALRDFIYGKQCICIPPQDDDTDIVIADAIHEVLEARKTKKELAEKILSMIEEEEKQARTVMDSLAVDNLMGLVDDIEQLCREQLEDNHNNDTQPHETKEGTDA